MGAEVNLLCTPAPPHPGTERADDAHLALEDVDELGHFVNLQPAQESPHAGDARISVAGDAGALVRCVSDHGAELVDSKQLTVLPDPLTPVEHWPRRVKPDGDSRDQPERQSNEDDQKRDNEVEGAFHHG